MRPATTPDTFPIVRVNHLDHLDRDQPFLSALPGLVGAQTLHRDAMGVAT